MTTLGMNRDHIHKISKYAKLKKKSDIKTISKEIRKFRVWKTDPFFLI